FPYTTLFRSSLYFAKLSRIDSRSRQEQIQMSLSRRSFLASAGAALATAAAANRFDGFHIGVTDWNLQQTGKLEAVTLAKSLGFDGVQISLGRKPIDDKLPLDNAEVQAQYMKKSRQESIPLDGTCLDILHVNYL